MKKELLDTESRVEGEVIIVIETIEKVLTLDDLIKQKNNISQRKQRLRKQMINIKKQYEEYDRVEKEYDDLIEKLDIELSDIEE